MRCSSCESHLAPYADRTLSPLRRAAIAAHLQSCGGCRELYERVRNVDALLETGRPAELPHDFTQALMGRVAAMPVPVRRVPPVWRIAAIYLGCAWLLFGAIAGTVRLPVPGASSIPALLSGVRAVELGARSLWPVAPLAITAGVALLIVDALLLAAIVLFYRTVHPRVAATLAAPAEAKR